MKNIRVAMLVYCISFLLGAPHPAVAGTSQNESNSAHGNGKSSFEKTYPVASPLGKVIGRSADAALDTAAAGDLPTAQDQADAAFLLACAYGGSRDIDAFREAAFTRRLVKQLADSPYDTRGDLLTFLRAHPVLAHMMVFAIGDRDNVRGVYALLDRLRSERPKQLEHYPELATALCIVRDRPLHRQINENKVTAADPLDVFDFYVSHESQMFYGLRGVPVELLCYIVDNPASIEDMNWALGKYAGTRDVGALFFSITYDFAYYDGKADKKLDSAPGGFTLPNILRFGGVCADQAYFATTVGKSIGVPAAITGGESALAGHAWVGFLKSSGSSAAWNFDSGRYADYQLLRGNVTDPQTGKSVADSTVGLLGDLIGSNPILRQDAVALTDAAKVWGSDETNGDAAPAFPPELLPASKSGKPNMKTPAARRRSADGELDLIELGLRQFADYPAGWALVADLAQHGKLSEPQKRKWADLTQRMCGQKHMDFAISILEPMIETVTDAGEQSDLWDAVFKFVQSRPDLAAGVRMHQGKMWEKQNNLTKAGQCYEYVIQHYINAGPFALPALRGAESVLKKLGQDKNVVDLYAEAAKLVAKPDMLSGRAEFMHESNWYKVREAYAKKLEDAGQTQLADQIRSQDKG
jgi:hypothetical protein